MTDDTVKKLERSQSDENACPPSETGVTVKPGHVCKKKNACDDGEQCKCVQQAVRENAELHRIEIEEMMPLQQLVEYDFIYECHGADTDQYTGQKNFIAGRLRRIFLSHFNIPFIYMYITSITLYHDDVNKIHKFFVYKKYVGVDIKYMRRAYIMNGRAYEFNHQK